MLVLWNDRSGLALMFFMPILLVFVITIIQDSAFQMVNENKISILIINKDKGAQGDRLVTMLDESRFFSITRKDELEASLIKEEMSVGSQVTALIIPVDFSNKLIGKSNLISGIMMEELELSPKETTSTKLEMTALKFYHDPVLQENYSSSIVNVVNAYVQSIEGELLITQICKEFELKDAPEKLQAAMMDNQIAIEQYSASLGDNDVSPNSTQHNVPAWTIFAIFFMVIPLGNNIVKERINGSFIRLKTMPTNFVLILGAKLFVYLWAVVTQVIVIFTLTKLTFPLIGLPPLTMPDNTVAFLVVVIFTGLSAISFASAVGTGAKTQEQANGFGAVAIVIFAAIGGILVPSFVMPQYMKFVSLGSPLHWCLECFYTLFLRGGDWALLIPDLIGLFVFSLICFGITVLHLKKNKII